MVNKDEIIRLAIKCQLVNAGNREGLYMDALTEFAALVAAAEREECAKVCDQIEEGANPDGSHAGGLAWECADAIRARGQHD